MCVCVRAENEWVRQEVQEATEKMRARKLSKMDISVSTFNDDHSRMQSDDLLIIGFFASFSRFFINLFSLGASVIGTARLV